MLLYQIRDFIASLGIAEKEHCYNARLPNGEEKSIGIYNQKRGSKASAAPGGKDNKSYGIKSVSLLIHWGTSQVETEKAALELQNRLEACRNYDTGKENIKFINVYYDEPVPIGTDESGIYEYVIECDIYYEEG